MTKEDDEIAAYQARLKKSSFRLSSIDPKLLFYLGFPLLVFGGLILNWRLSHPDADSSTELSSPPRPPTEGELASGALQKVADDYAGLDPMTLEAGDLALAKGRKVVFVQQTMDLDPESARTIGSSGHLQRNQVKLPEDFARSNPAPFALTPEEAGVVVLLRGRMIRSGTYSGGNEPAMDLDYTGEAILVPERAHIAKIHHHVSAPSSATRMNGILVGDFTHDDGKWLRDAAVELNAGHAPAL